MLAKGWVERVAFLKAGLTLSIGMYSLKDPRSGLAVSVLEQLGMLETGRILSRVVAGSCDCA